MATTTNFGWTTPDDTALVKDGASAIRTLGSSIDTSMMDLKGGTTGQVLSKASNTDMDFTWVAQDDSNAIQNAIVDAKGDLISATAADTPARLAVGTNGQYLKANSSTATGLEWADITAGGMTVLASGSLSSTGVNITSISQSYKNLVFYVRSFLSSSGSGQVRLNGDSGSNYRWSRIEVAATSLQAGAATTQFNLEYSDSATILQQIQMEIRDYTNTGTTGKQVTYGVARDTNYAFHFGSYKTTSAITSLNLFGTSSTLSGTYVLYGVN